MASHSIKSKTARSKLTPQREPYWDRLGKGLHIGFRKLEGDGGSWTGRRGGETTRYEYHSLGSDMHLDYDEACKAIRQWDQERTRGIQDNEETVADICRLYVEDRRIEKGPKTAYDANMRFERLVYNAPIGKIQFKELRFNTVNKWRNDQIEECDDEEAYARQKDSANRNLKSFKAACNFGLKSRLCADDHAWKAVKLFKDVGASREELLTVEQRQKFLNAMPEDLRKLAKALLLTGARPGEMAKAKLSDFDKKTGILRLKGKTGLRDVHLSETACDHFTDQAKDRIGNAYIFVRAEDGVAWQAPMWGKIVREIRDGIGLKDIVLYHLRHAFISENLAQGIDVFSIAKLCGTSVEIIQRHYGKFVPTNIQARLNKVAIL